MRVMTLAKNKCRSLKLAIQAILKCVQYIQQKMKHTSQVPVLPYLDQELCTSIIPQSYIHPSDVCTLLDKNEGKSERENDKMS